jgi:uncharacterized protein
MNNTSKLQEIDLLCASIPSFQCKPECSDCCGPIVATHLEMKRCVQAAGMTLKEYGAEVKRRIKSKNLECVFLDKEAKRCKVYAVRPMICRLFGAVDHPKMTCPHGCRPEGRSPMISQQAKALLDAAAQIAVK